MRHYKRYSNIKIRMKRKKQEEIFAVLQMEKNEEYIQRLYDMIEKDLGRVEAEKFKEEFFKNYKNLLGIKYL
ncbi:MAG: hypothetical protein ACTSR3_07745 [Candidatus Helarchaeota archaeon]